MPREIKHTAVSVFIARGYEMKILESQEDRVVVEIRTQGERASRKNIYKWTETDRCGCKNHFDTRKQWRGAFQLQKTTYCSRHDPGYRKVRRKTSRV